MAKYIPLDAVLAEIEKLMYAANLEADITSTGECFDENIADAKYQLCNYILGVIKNLEVKKEVDLEKEINTYISNNFFGSETIGFYANRTKEEPNDQDIALCAKHFFELGLRASNPLTWEDIKTIDKLLNQCVDYSNPYQEVLKRFKAQKGE